MTDLTVEEIAQNYNAALDSVDLINAGKPADMSDEDWTDTVARNKEHLNIMIAKDYWTNEDLSSMTTAAA
jgi:hypothetical protein